LIVEEYADALDQMRSVKTVTGRREEERRRVWYSDVPNLNH